MLGDLIHIWVRMKLLIKTISLILFGWKIYCDTSLLSNMFGVGISIRAQDTLHKTYCLKWLKLFCDKCNIFQHPTEQISHAHKSILRPTYSRSRVSYSPIFLGYLSHSGVLLLWVGVRRPLTSSSQELLGQQIWYVASVG